MSAASRNRTVSITSSGRSRGRTTEMQDFAMQPPKVRRFFEPCAATASMFLYAQGSSIVCCHHDTLTIERRFSRHADEVQLLAVDTQSDVGAGQLVVSYDAGQTAIVWDLMTGDEVARFASYEHLTVAAWMRNGNVAFGNTQGNIMLFEPTTSEHISARTIDQIPVTALAPAADCRTFAIGYQNGSLLIATLQPRFTILHNLSTSRAPSPIVTLAWHASSSRQKSDMLAVQTHDGDLRVWSVAKSYNSDDPAKVVRILKRTENYHPGPNWMGWSKNGRIIQFSDSETLSWDVRTKHVTFDAIPTLEMVRGLAVYGPGASLFTLGANNTVQQFDLNSPSIIVCNVQHPANLLPPSPPVSIEEQQGEKSATTIATSESEAASGPLDTGISESDDDHLSPFARLAKHQHHELVDRYDTNSPVSSRSGVSSNLSMSSAGSGTPRRHPASVQSRTLTENTYMSMGSSMRSSVVPGQGQGHGHGHGHGHSQGHGRSSHQRVDAQSISTFSNTSMTSSNRSRPKAASRLRNEVLRSPDDTKVHDLFKFTRSRLSDIPYKHPAVSDNSLLTNDDLRRQMLSTIFGWNKEIEDLVRDEMSRHPPSSPNRILLAKWLGDLETDIMAASAESMTSSDWMLLALSGIGGQSSQHKLGRAYVQRLLEKGDVHAAATIMIGMGDHNDAIEIYVSHKQYMEALILTCLFFPSVWERQSAIIKKWGEWAVMHGQQQLAVRCFSCTGKESTEPWTSPSATQMNFQNPSIPEILSPPLSPPGLNRGPQRSIAKTSALKLITSFGDQNAKSKFFSNADGGQTPIAAGVTPIAESAISPGGFDVTTAFIRPSSRSQFGTPASARSNTSNFSRQRLPSIGEIPNDMSRDALKAGALPTPPVDAMARMSSLEQESLAAGLALQRAQTASPMMMRTSHKKHSTKVEPPPSPDAMVVVKLEKQSKHRNGSRDRIPQGLRLEIQPVEKSKTEVTSPDQAAASSARYHWPSRRRGPGSVASSAASNSSAGRSFRSGNNRPAPSDYIHSLDVAQHYSKKQRSRQSSREGKRESSRGRTSSQDRAAAVSREPSEERGRASGRTWPKPKRSPTSPIPMSPEDLINLSTPKMFEFRTEQADPVTVRKTSISRQQMREAGSRTSSRGSRRKSPDTRPRPPALDIRGRSQTREGSMARSPSSPLPMSANAALYERSDGEEDKRRVSQAKSKRTGSRSASRGPREPMSPGSSKRERSVSRRRPSATKESFEAAVPMPPPPPRTPLPEHVGDLRVMKDERQRKKEEAARELEERRKSLAQRPSAPPIPHPNQFSPGLRPEQGDAPVSMDMRASEPPRSMYAPGRSSVHIGLPATPKAMRLILEGDKGGVPGVPPIPASYVQQQQQQQQQQKSSPGHSPKSSPGKAKEPEREPPKEAEDVLTLLPSTVYQPPVRVSIPRSMSAPIPDDPKDMQQRVSRGKSVRSSNRGEIRGIDEMLGKVPRRSSHEDQIPPPPPVPLLKELAHLAVPPPPPPAPLPHLAYSEQPPLPTPATIEIVMDDDEQPPVAAPVDSTVPVIAPPVPRSGHSRGRSIPDAATLSSRFNKATERLRSASRSRKESRAKSPPMEGPAPYESIPGLSYKGQQSEGPAPYESIPPVTYNRDVVRSPVLGSGQFQTGLHESELI